MHPLAYVLAGFGGFIVYEGLQDKPPPGAGPNAPVTSNTSKFLPLNGAHVANVTALPGSVKLKQTATAVGGMSIPKNISFTGIKLNGAFSKTSKQTAGAHQQLIDKTEQELKAKFDKLSKAEKQKGADALNKLIKPSPGLTADDDWKSASKKVGASLGTLAGGAACGPPCAALGAVAGAYLGDKLGDEIAKKWKDVSSWAKDAYGSVKDKVTNTVKKILPFI